MDPTQSSNNGATATLDNPRNTSTRANSGQTEFANAETQKNASKKKANSEKKFTEHHHIVPKNLNPTSNNPRNKQVEEVPEIGEILDSPLIKALYYITNLSSVACNLSSSFANSFTVSDSFRKKADWLSDKSTRVALFVNGTVLGLYQALVNNNLLSGIAYGFQPAIAWFSKLLKDVFNLEGFSTGLNLISLGLNHYDDDKEFKDYPDYIARTYGNIRKAFQEIYPSPKVQNESRGKKIAEVVNRLLGKNSGLLTFINGVSMIFSSFLMFIPGLKKIGAFGRNTIGAFQDLIRMKYSPKGPQFWSGVSFLGASLFDYGPIFKTKEKIMVPLVQACQRLGGMLSGISFAFEGEITKGAQEKAQEEARQARYQSRSKTNNSEEKEPINFMQERARINSYYEVLGIKPGASIKELKAAYRKQMRKHHPDRGGDTKIAQRVSEAYDELTKIIKASEKISNAHNRQGSHRQTANRAAA